MMTFRRRKSNPCLLSVGLILAVVDAGRSAPAQNLTQSAFFRDDLLVCWQVAGGTTITYRGLPVFLANPSEFVVHRAWKKVFYRTQQSRARAALTRSPEQTALTIKDRSEHFAWEKKVFVRKGAVRIEYSYELLDPENAELQVLFGVGKPWIHKSTYRATTGGREQTGELACPDTGRIDPLPNASRLTFTTEFGTLTISSQRGLNLLCTPTGGALWWSQPLKKGETYTETLDVTISPGPKSDTGLVLSDLSWSTPVRTNQVPVTLQLARKPGGPRRVQVHLERARDRRPAGEPVTATLTDKPTRITCTAPLRWKGTCSFALVVDDADTGEERIRLAPLQVDYEPALRAMPRLSLYTDQPTAQLIVDVAADVSLDQAMITVTGAGVAPVTQSVTTRRNLISLPLAGLSDGVHSFRCRLARGDTVLGETEVEVRKAPPKPNAVVIDNLSRGLIVDGLPFIPFGYYTYYPLKEGVIDEEVVRGFNLFSPYHGGPHTGDALKPIIDYLDHCAAVGMKVNYHLKWATPETMTQEQWQAMREEIMAVRDHPALLSWYIADEPPTERLACLEQVYRLLKELDPYHPVTQVFCRGAAHARQFVDALDIVMADPYPIPNGPVTAVSRTADAMNEVYDFAKPLWIVPQCFGGNEGWRREPTAREQRVMTYLALLHGATGIQYFIRSPRISFPKSPSMWAECGTLALETAELTPALLSVEPAPEVKSSVPSVHARAYRHQGLITLVAVNTENRPQTVTLSLTGVDYSGGADVLFEDRKVVFTSGRVEEPLDAFGTRVYAIPVGPQLDDDLSIDPKNLTVNPSYEWLPSVGVPAGCYAGIPPGATFTVDSRVARHGRHSLRLHAPSPDATPSISPFPVPLRAGIQYRVSLWAKAAAPGVKLRFSLGKLGGQECPLTTQWKEFSFTVKPDADLRRAGASIGLASSGTAWVDLFQIAPVEAASEPET